MWICVSSTLPLTAGLILLMICLTCTVQRLTSKDDLTSSTGRVIPQVYDITAAQEHAEMRKVVLDFAVKHKDELVHGSSPCAEAFRQVLKEVPEFMVGFVEMAVARPASSWKSRLPAQYRRRHQ